MTIIEINKGSYLNVDNMFKFDLEKNDEGQYFFRFHSISDNTTDSRVFETLDLAREWIAIRIMRAAGANEILGL